MSSSQSPNRSDNSAFNIEFFPCTDVRFADVMALRKAVFEGEQGVPDMEDATDAIAVHAGLYLQGELVATARLYPTEHNGFRHMLKMGRVAVSQSQRGTGLGKTLMQAVLHYAADAGWQQAMLHGQVHASGFYTRLGFKPVGQVFIEAGIDHLRFELDLTEYSTIVQRANKGSLATV